MTMSDDQIAILGSFAALAFCGVLMALSYQFGAAGRRKSETHAVRPQETTGQGKSVEERRAA